MPLAVDGFSRSGSATKRSNALTIPSVCSSGIRFFSVAFCLRSENAQEANELVKKFSSFLYHSALEKNNIASREDIYYNPTPHRQCKSQKNL